MEGVTLTGMVLTRYGRLFHAIVNIVSVLYMGIYLCSELTAIGALFQYYGVSPIVPLCVLSATTAVYTSVGGMQASLVTDMFQGWIVLILLIIAGTAIAFQIHITPAAVQDSNLVEPTRMGWESLYVLLASCFSATMFHQG